LAENVLKNTILSPWPGVKICHRIEYPRDALKTGRDWPVMSATRKLWQKSRWVLVNV